MSTYRSSTSDTESFQASSYHGRQIATFRHGIGWLAYLDQVMEAGKVFATAADATAWLRKRIDDPRIQTPASLA